MYKLMRIILQGFLLFLDANLYTTSNFSSSSASSINVK
jgi:hypothetical protein